MPFRFKARTSLTSQSASCESVSALTTRTHSPQPASVRRFLPSRRVLCAISTFRSEGAHFADQPERFLRVCFRADYAHAFAATRIGAQVFAEPARIVRNQHI